MIGNENVKFDKKTNDHPNPINFIQPLNVYYSFKI